MSDVGLGVLLVFVWDHDYILCDEKGRLRCSPVTARRNKCSWWMMTGWWWWYCAFMNKDSSLNHTKKEWNFALKSSVYMMLCFVSFKIKVLSVFFGGGSSIIGDAYTNQGFGGYDGYICGRHETMRKWNDDGWRVSNKGLTRLPRRSYLDFFFLSNKTTSTGINQYCKSDRSPRRRRKKRKWRTGRVEKFECATCDEFWIFGQHV